MLARASFAMLVVALLVLASRTACAEPWFGWGQGALEDHYDDGDFDVDDLLAHTQAAGRQVGAATTHRESYVTVGLFGAVLRDGTQELGAMLVAGIAFDRVAQGAVHRTINLDRHASELGDVLATSAFAQPPAPPTTPAPAPVPAPVVLPPRVVVTAAVARRAVAAAWRASGLGVDDARIDSMIARARASALLPEARLRAMRVLNDTSKVDAIPDTTGTYLAVGANLWLEARLTWRLDRVLIADDAPPLERVRLERPDAVLLAERIPGKRGWQRGIPHEMAAAHDEIIGAVQLKEEGLARLQGPKHP